MPERENYRNESEPVTFKWLSLISPKRAAELGVETEAPILVSRYVSKEKECHCGVKYSPLAYFVGKETFAQHHHPEEENGGIYFRRLHRVLFDDGIGRGDGFLAIIDPRGTVTDTASDSIIVKQLLAFCESTTPHQISDGLLVEMNNGALKPMCEDHLLDLEIDRAHLAFQLNGDELRFSYSS